MVSLNKGAISPIACKWPLNYYPQLLIQVGKWLASNFAHYHSNHVRVLKSKYRERGWLWPIKIFCSQFKKIDVALNVMYSWIIDGQSNEQCVVCATGGYLPAVSLSTCVMSNSLSRTKSWKWTREPKAGRFYSLDFSGCNNEMNRLSQNKLAINREF